MYITILVKKVNLYREILEVCPIPPGLCSEEGNTYLNDYWTWNKEQLLSATTYCLDKFQHALDSLNTLKTLRPLEAASSTVSTWMSDRLDL